MTVKSGQSENHSQDAIQNCPGDEKNRIFGTIPARYILTACLCLGNAIMFSHRVNITIAIVAMVNKTESEKMLAESNGNDTEYTPSCPYPSDWNSTITKDNDIKEGSFVWSPSTQGFVLGGFYYGYVLTQIAGGWLSERFAPKMIYLGGMVASSIFTLLVPIVAEFNFGLFVALRVITGISQGFTIASAYMFVATWIPNRERSLNLAIMLVGGLVGTMASLPLVGYLCQEGFAGGWPSAFYVLGIAGIAYATPAYFLIYNKPQDHPRISRSELLYVQQNMIQSSSKKMSVPWSAVFRSVPIWALACSRFTSNFTFNIVNTKVPTYLDAILHYPIQQNGVLSSLLYVLEACVQVTAGFLSDLVQRRKLLSTNATRKVFQTIASSGTAVCLLLVPFVKCEGTAVVVLLAASLGFLGLCSGGELPVVADMAPAFSGSLFGLTNSIGSITGFLAPLIAGVILEGHDASITHWSYIFFLSAGLTVLGGLVFLTLGEARLQPWAQVTKTDGEEPKTQDKERF